MSAAKHTPGPNDAREEFLRNEGPWHANVAGGGLFVVARTGGAGMLGRFRSMKSAEQAAAKANAAITKATGSASCCRSAPCKHPGVGPCDMPAKATGSAS